MDDLLKPLEHEHEKLLAEQGELDALGDALACSTDRIDSLTQAAEELMRDLRNVAGMNDSGER